MARPSEFFEVGATFGTLVVIQHCEGEIVDVGRDAEAEHQHQQRSAKQAETEPDRVAQQFKRLPDRVGE